MRRFAHSLFALSAAFLIMISLSGCGRSESNAQPEKRNNQTRAIKVSVVKVKPVPIRDILVLPGDTEAWQDVLVAADKGGRVDFIGPSEGDTVEKGDLLAKIDVSALKAALDRAEAAFKLADDLYQRRQNLFERKIINKEELDRAQTERTLAQARPPIAASHAKPSARTPRSPAPRCPVPLPGAARFLQRSPPPRTHSGPAPARQVGTWAAGRR